MKYFLGLLAIFCLVGCQKEDLSHSYLMTHPYVLKAKVTACQENGISALLQTSQCEKIMYAAANFMALLDEQQADPEKFGEKIMQAELDYQTTLEKQKSASPEDIVLKEKEQQVKILLAVVGLSSPG